MCSEAIAKCEAIGPLKRAMTLRRDLLYSISETLHSLFERHHDNLVKQVYLQNSLGTASLLGGIFHFRPLDLYRLTF